MWLTVKNYLHMENNVYFTIVKAVKFCGGKD